MTNTPGDGEQPADPYRPPSDQGDEPTAPQQPYGDQQQVGYPQQPYGGQQPGYPPQQPGYPPQPYGQPGYPPMGYQQQDHPKATTSLVLGILGIVICSILAPFAWRMGKRTVAEIDASNGQLGGRGSAQAGYVLGLIGTILLGIGLAFIVVYVVIIIVAFSTGSMS